MNPKRLVFADWWSLRDQIAELEGGKSARWERPDEDGQISNLMPGEKMPEIEQMEKEGWVFGDRIDNLKVTDATDRDVILKFVE